MALVLSPLEKILNSQGMAEITHQGDKIRLYGKRGTLQHFGLPVFNPAGDLGQAGVDKLLNRVAHRRSRWLGDTVKSGVRGNDAVAFLYPSRRGRALPGVPIVLENLSTMKKWTLQLDGQIGVLIAYWTQNRPPFDVQLYGKTGNRYSDPIRATVTPPGA